MFNELLEMLPLFAIDAAPETPTPVNPDMLISIEEQKVGETALNTNESSNENIETLLDEVLSEYILRLKETNPNKPPLVSQAEFSRVIVNDHADVSESDNNSLKTSWYLSKLCKSTYKTRLCDRENPSKDSIIRILSGQVIEKSNIATLNTSEEKRKAVKFTGELLKMYINTQTYMETRESGSSHINLAARARNELNIDLTLPPMRVLSNVGCMLTPPIGYVLTDSGPYSLSSEAWNDLSGISKVNAEKTVAHITSDFFDINEIYNEMCRNITLRSQNPGIVPRVRPSLVEFMNGRGSSNRSRMIVNPFTSATNTN